MNDFYYWVAFNHLQGITSKHIFKLHAYFGDMEHAWRASHTELVKSGVRGEAVSTIIEQRSTINLQKLATKIRDQHISALHFAHKDYPPLLKELPDPPAILYIRGNRDLLSQQSLSVVGTRKASTYGLQVMQRFESTLAQHPLPIVSGLAFGIDALAHRAALKAEAPTIAILGSGVDDASIGPRTNVPLAREILQYGGAVVSEYPPSTQSQAYHFPERNRIIAGLSPGTLVIEAGRKSGSLITARLALDYNREVFAVPGSIFSQTSLGTNDLIRQGAIPVADMQEVWKALHFIEDSPSDSTPQKLQHSPEEQDILQHLSHEPLSLEFLVQRTGKPISELNSTLTILEIAGVVQPTGNGSYVLTGKTK